VPQIAIADDKTRNGRGQPHGELFQLGVEGGEFVRHLGVAHSFDPLLRKLLGKPDASIAPFEACIFLGRQHHEFIAAVRGGAVRGGDRHRLAAGVYVLNHSQHNFRQRTTQADLDEIEDWTDRAARRMY
jgi:hypothetical protein